MGKLLLLDGMVNVKGRFGIKYTELVKDVLHSYYDDKYTIFIILLDN
jgi:hypothetical protein